MTATASHLQTASISLRDLSVRLGLRTILSGISLNFLAGEFVVILGQNGAGKTTLLRTLAGLTPFTGEIGVNGAPLSAMSARVRASKIAYLPQGGTVHWPMSVEEIVSLGRIPFASDLRDLASRDQAAIEQALSDCDLTDLRHRDVTRLSGGERARVLLGRVLAVDAPILLADEPTTFLDPAHQTTTMRVLAREAARGRIVVAVLHDVALALRYATRIIGLVDGNVAIDATPQGFLESDRLNDLYKVRYEMAALSGGRLTPVAEI